MDGAKRLGAFTDDEGYSHLFDAEQGAARKAKAGLWAGAFIEPWHWRKRNCTTTVMGALSVPIDADRKLCGAPDVPPDPACTIKANLRSDKCIYHVEGGSYYGKMRMGGSNKRWFCSTAEAEAAGCRRSAR